MVKGFRWFATLVIALAVVFCVSCDTEDDDDDEEQEDLADPEPSDDSYAPTGPTDDGRVILPNGRFISPLGNRVTVKRFPLNLVMHPDGDRLFVPTTKTPSLAIVDPVTMTLVREEALGKHAGGIAINAAGQKMWIGAGAREVVYEYDLGGDLPVLSREIHAFGYPIGLALSSDEQLLYVCLAYGKRVAIIDTDSGLEVGSLNTGTYPHTIAVSDRLNRAIVSNWGTRSASVFDLSDNSLLADVDVGKNPEGVIIAPDGVQAFVACSDTDDVHVINLETLVVDSVIRLYAESEHGLGVMPTYLALSPDQSRLYVVASGFNSIDVIDLETESVVGRIPTEWYPTAVLPKEDTLYILSGKGIGSGPGNVGDSPPEELPAEGGKLLGSVEALPVPDAETLEEYTAMVEENNTRTTRFYEDLAFDSPIPSERGKPSEQIKHVVFILKENKTFDQVFGDLSGVDADPDLLIFGEYYTPNMHALARQFATSDNYYSESHESDMGHLWATAAICNDYVEKAWVMSNWKVLTGVEEGAIPESKFIFQKLVENEIDFRIYGEVTGTVSDIETLAPYMDFDYGFYNMTVADRVKAQEVIREWELGVFPTFIFILLPNDHTAGTSTGEPTMDYYVGDNDAGTGMLVNWVTYSEHWSETLMIITEDDPQSGVDHIDAHRTPFILVSPYVKHGYVSSVHYSMASVWLTIELILGLPAMTDYDRNTAPMYDLFTTAPDLTPYAYIPSNVPYAENQPGAPMSNYCNRQDWSVPDQVERIAEVAWAYMRPGEPFPHHLHVYYGEEDEEEEAEEGRRYKELMEAYLRYARENNLLSEHSLVGKTIHPK